MIRKTAREMADAAPAVIVHPGRHVTWYGDDTQRTEGSGYPECTAWTHGAGAADSTDQRPSTLPEPVLILTFPTPIRTWRTLSRVNVPAGRHWCCANGDL
ncbi:MAG: hypothetical protein MZV63_31500 [Marinilabiliales bacterium]|nr:hypothetical protein [Marinilabiliales bacterium]